VKSEKEGNEGKGERGTGLFLYISYTSSSVVGKIGKIFLYILHDSSFQFFRILLLTISQVRSE
jgi:hypothetical protein